MREFAKSTVLNGGCQHLRSLALNHAKLLPEHRFFTPQTNSNSMCLSLFQILAKEPRFKLSNIQLDEHRRRLQYSPFAFGPLQTISRNGTANRLKLFFGEKVRRLT